MLNKLEMVLVAPNQLSKEKIIFPAGNTKERGFYLSDKIKKERFDMQKR